MSTLSRTDLAHLARLARLAVTDAAERAIVTAREAVGLAGQFLTHPLSAMLADLSVYLRQPVPDSQRLRVGAAVGQGSWICWLRVTGTHSIWRASTT